MTSYLVAMTVLVIGFDCKAVALRWSGTVVDDLSADFRCLSVVMITSKSSKGDLVAGLGYADEVLMTFVRTAFSVKGSGHRQILSSRESVCRLHACLTKSSLDCVPFVIV